MRYPDAGLPWAVDYQAVKLIAESEQGPGGGAALKSYRCPAGRWTIGWGHTGGVRPTDVWTETQADRMLCDEIEERAEQVKRACTVEPSPTELGAMVSFQYNIGAAAFASSTVLRQHNAGRSEAAARAFGLWNKSRDPSGQLRTLPGLTARRAREAALYLQDAPGSDQPTPKAVAPESSLVRSPIAQSGATAAGAGVVAAISDAGERAGAVGTAVHQVRDVVVNTLGVPADWFVPAALVGVGAVVLWNRWRQRTDGWA